MPHVAFFEVTPAMLETRAAEMVSAAIALREASAPLRAALTAAEEQPGLQVAAASGEGRLRWTDNLLLGSIAVAETGMTVAHASAGYVEVEQANADSFQPAGQAAAP